MFKEKLEEMIQNNPDGFTIDAYGNNFYPDKGYSVGIREVTVDEAVKIVEDWHRWEQCGIVPKFGGWTDNGKFYLDRVLYIGCLFHAMETAKQHNQLAIYSFATGETIFV